MVLTRRTFKTLIFTVFLAVLLLMSIHVSECMGRTELVIGEFSSTYNDNQSMTEAKDLCKKNALRNAFEAALLYVSQEIRSKSSRIKNLNVHSLAKDFLRNVKILEENVDGRNIYCRVQGNVNISDLEKRLEKLISEYRIKPDQKIEISFYDAVIEKSQSYCKDDSNPAPDSSVRVKDRHGNEIFVSGRYLLNKRKYTRLLINRNNYNPHFEGASFTYTFTKGDYLLVYLMDWDGIEGFLGQKKSQDDIIGTPFRINLNYPLGKNWIGGKGWKLKMEIIECE